MGNSTTLRQQRLIGEYQGDFPGKTLVLVGAVHGNEREGVEAIRSVLRELERRRPTFRGRLLGLIGNPKAYDRNVRYVDSDLNRLWRPEAQACEVTQQTSEYRDFRALKIFLQQLGEGQGAFHLIDLHSFSGDGEPFMVAMSDDEDEALIRDLPIPVVYGLDHLVGGSMAGHLVSEGRRAICFEGGKREDPETLTNMIAFLWSRLVHLDCIDPAVIPERAKTNWANLHTSRTLPSAIHAGYRHSIQDEDKFKMKPGFRTFDRVWSGQELAQDRHGCIRSPQDGYILMPLYQNQGCDGFFIGHSK